LCELALLGSRMSSFHHDLASKVQALMMSLDEISERATNGESTIGEAAENAQDAIRAMHQLLTANRALTKPPVRATVALAELLQHAAARARVQLRTADWPRCEVHVFVPAVTHALAQVLEVAAGPSPLDRSVDAALAFDGAAVVTLTGPGETVNTAAPAGELLALAAFAIDREGGALTCAANGTKLVARLPLAQSAKSE
jgi:hypothetical protein